MNYEYLRTFYEVCKAKSFSKAAENLYTSQPAVSRTILIIENELNTKLFNRSKHGVTLTQSGEELYERIKIPFINLERIDEDFSNQKTLSSKTIRIGATATAFECFLFDFLEKVKSEIKDIHIKIKTGSSDSIINMVENEEVDIAFITTPYVDTKDLDVFDLLPLDIILIGNIKYKDEFKKPITLKEASRYPHIMLSNEMQFRIHINSFLNFHNIKINPEIETDSSAMLIPLVEHDYGLAFIPKPMCKKAIENNQVIEIKLKETISDRNISLITKPDNKPNSLTKKLLKLIIQNTGE